MESGIHISTEGAEPVVYAPSADPISIRRVTAETGADPIRVDPKFRPLAWPAETRRTPTRANLGWNTMDRIYLRHSTDKQTDARQRHALAALLKAGAPVYDDPATKMMVNVLASVLEFQRDMISENTRRGVAAAEASGKTLGRPAALAADTASPAERKAHKVYATRIRTAKGDNFA